jgi:hypothetical protein
LQHGEIQFTAASQGWVLEAPSFSNVFMISVVFENVQGQFTLRQILERGIF